MSTKYICGCVEADGVRDPSGCAEGHVPEPPAEVPEPEPVIEDDAPTKKKAATKKTAAKKK